MCHPERQNKSLKLFLTPINHYTQINFPHLDSNIICSLYFTTLDFTLKLNFSLSHVS